MDAAGDITMEESVKESELIGKVHSAVYHQCQQRGYAAPADVLVDIGILPKQKPVIPLRFSKNENPEIEKAYATHYNLAVVLCGIIMKYRRLSVFPAVWHVAVLKSYRRWSRPYAILSGNPGSSGKFSVLLFSVAVAFPLSATSWKGVFCLQTVLSGISVQLHIGRSLPDAPAGTALYPLLYKTDGRQIC